MLLAVSYWEDMRAYGHAAMVMWLYGRAYQLERKLHGGERGGGKKWRGAERETEKKKFNIRETSQQIAFILMRRRYGTLPNFTINGKRG